ncbi:unnamed protein product [Paramecium octaurelia]|uniref:Uncharacterized protein n=1 Tax=Paramecium octaurelia TaxID=43137 RepID=A0A8S1X041_PAROT|nr:unnamed protein product [Paramecium octaurelia]
MNQKTSTDCCVQTDLDQMEIEMIENLSPKMIYSNLLSRSVNLRSKNLKIDVKNNFNTFQLRKIDTFEQNSKQLKGQRHNYNHKSFHNENELKPLRKRQFIPKSFHIETFNNIATPQQIILPQKQQFTPLHVLKRKLNYPANPYRLKTCPDDSKFCDRILYTNIIPEKIKHFDGIKAFK